MPMKRLDVKQHTVFRFIHQLNLCFLVVSSSFHIAFACLWECFKRARCMYVYVCVCAGVFHWNTGVSLCMNTAMPCCSILWMVVVAVAVVEPKECFWEVEEQCADRLTISTRSVCATGSFCIQSRVF